MEKYYNYNNRSQISSRTLEITVLSGEDLRINNRPVSKNAFVTVRLGGGESRSTAMDADGGSYPRWDERFVVEFTAGHSAASLTVEVRCKTAFGEKIVGTASVPAADFSGGYVPESYLHFLSYRLRDSKGRRNGIVNLSVRTKSSPDHHHHHQYTCSAEERSPSPATVGVPVGNNNDNNSSAGVVVTGVPVLGSYQRISYY